MIHLESIPIKKLQKHQITEENIAYLRKIERQKEFHFDNFFTLLGGAISNDALMVANASYSHLFPKAKGEDKTVRGRSAYDRLIGPM